MLLNVVLSTQYQRLTGEQTVRRTDAFAGAIAEDLKEPTAITSYYHVAPMFTILH